MSRLLLLCPSLRHRTTLFSKTGCRLTHSEKTNNRDLSPTESAVGMVVFFTAFFSPMAYVLTNLSRFKRE
ncbi:cytochrome c oxidase subunit 8C, mitochondrial [Meriones unguiculatus]|uniref:cytochrome c oxidase subunit 8C, mitochondrial n=1 Tax=Meriones unguiculatus TaxID=10047 RepID=UPI000B4F9247|nr:cytochrome c oxidase subunit 8C, mitochondrial [Meriones unguiculatus]